MGVRGGSPPSDPTLREKVWAATVLLTYMQDTGLLTRLKVTKAFIAFEKQTEV